MSSTSWSSYRPNGDGSPDPRRHRASTAPAGTGYPAHPRALMPGHVSSLVDRSDIYFTNASRMVIAQDVRNSHFSSPPPVPLYPAYMAGQYHHSPPPPPPPRPPPPDLFFQRSFTAPPPIPPKPPTLPAQQSLEHAPSRAISFSGSTITEVDTPSPESPTDEGDLAMALAMSQSVSSEEDKFRQALSTQEEEELAKALEASLLEVRASDRPPLQTGTSSASSSKSSTSYPPLPISHGIPSDTDTSSDEAFAQMLAAEQEEQLKTPVNKQELEARAEISDTVADLQRYSPPQSDYGAGPAVLSPPIASSSNVKLSDDEAFARRLALEDQYEATPVSPTITKVVEAMQANHSASLEPSNSFGHSPRTGSACEISPPEFTASGVSDDETYTRSLLADDDHDDTESVERPTTFTTSPSYSASPVSLPNQDLPSYAETAKSSDGSDMSHSTNSDHPSVVIWGAAPREQIISETRLLPTMPLSPTNSSRSTALSPASASPTPRPLSRLPSMNSISEFHDSGAQSNSSPNHSQVNLNYFVDKELYVGVSVGFTAPKISSQLVSMPDVMPNIISLPYGRCPPLHLQGPNWRHLLKLMARLSGTRLEPTLEAVAINKTDLKVRTVVQFLKPHHASPEWRTILYFTIDYPSPRPNYGQNVNELPYSYTLSSVPTLLRDAADTPISKFFTIPSSEAVPYPTLPITFPNLAMYLQAALEESRRYISDSSSGHRKLAKMMQTCYPQESPSETPERNSMGGLFKRVIGRKNNSTKPQRGGNEDTYELVTPFVQDEWG